MRIVQFERPAAGRRVGVVVNEKVHDVTSVNSDWKRITDVFQNAQSSGKRITEVLEEVLDTGQTVSFPYGELLSASPEAGCAFLHPPVDSEDPRRILITGTGLTHLGSMEARNEMHADIEQTKEEDKSDSMRMFEMGLKGGKPKGERRGVAPEWFYKGNGTNLRGHRWSLEVPEFALDGGEEPEVVGCYVIDEKGNPCRLGFALGNEWADHETEKINYLYLAPSKLRQCSVGPELITDCEFQEIIIRCRILRESEAVYDSGELFTGEKHMSHSLANCEDHHFKYVQHRQPGDIHLHYFGTSKLSVGTRDGTFMDGDEVRIDADGFSGSLVNTICIASKKDDVPVAVKLG